MLHLQKRYHYIALHWCDLVKYQNIQHVVWIQYYVAN